MPLAPLLVALLVAQPLVEVCLPPRALALLALGELLGAEHGRGRRRRHHERRSRHLTGLEGEELVGHLLTTYYLLLTTYYLLLTWKERSWSAIYLLLTTYYLLLTTYY
jgi:hypothetical protein